MFLVFQELHLKSNCCADALSKNNVVSQVRLLYEALNRLCSSCRDARRWEGLCPWRSNLQPWRIGPLAAGPIPMAGGWRGPAPAAVASCLRLQRCGPSSRAVSGDAPLALEGKAQLALHEASMRSPRLPRHSVGLCAVLGPQPPTWKAAPSPCFSALFSGGARILRLRYDWRE